MYDVLPEGLQTGRMEALPVDEVHPGVYRRTFSSEGLTVTAYRFEPGASFPLHRHPSEQVTIVSQGLVHFTAAEVTADMSEGEWSVVAPGIAHGLTAGPEGASILAIVTPRRGRADNYEVVSGSPPDPSPSPA